MSTKKTAKKTPTKSPKSRRVENPKEEAGRQKVDFSGVPFVVLSEIALGMAEGGYKYGLFNYRASESVRASTYYSALFRHLGAYWEGEDVDPGSGLLHITKAICSLVVLLDATITGNLEDDRPPRLPVGWLEKRNEEAVRLASKISKRTPRFTQRPKEKK